MELCGTQRPPETMLTYSEHREYRSFFGKTPLFATSITFRSVIRSESCSTFERPHGCRWSSTQCNFSQSSAILGNHCEISTWSDQCFLGGDASFANMEGSKSQCGVIVFLTHELLAWGSPARTSGLLDEQHDQTCGSELLAAEVYSVFEAVEEAQWLRSVLADVAFCSELVSHNP